MGPRLRHAGVKKAGEPWLVEKLVPGGEGFARLSDGRAAFAPGALPGDLITPVELVERRGYVRAESWRLVRGGPARVEAPCPVADRCGGCDWMHLERRAELDAKSALIGEALRRVGGFHLSAPPPVVTAGSDLAYRSRIELHVDDEGRIGFFARRSHDVVAVEGCPVAHDELNTALGRLKVLALEHPGGLSALSSVELRYATAPPHVVVSVSPRIRPLPAATEALLDELEKSYPVVLLGGASLKSEGAEQRYELPGGLALFAPPGVFTQVNWEVNCLVIAHVLEGAKERRTQTFLDLYAGAGNFTLPLLARGLRGLGVEQSRAAVAASRRAAEEAGLDPEAFIEGHAEVVARELVRQERRFDLILLDPPRAGARAALPAVLALAAPWVAVCSCDPATLARDLAVLAKGGYDLDGVQGFDMFPHTHHVEVLAWMRRAQ